jgi:hypothetical protein
VTRRRLYSRGKKVSCGVTADPAILMGIGGDIATHFLIATVLCLGVAFESAAYQGAHMYDKRNKVKC